MMLRTLVYLTLFFGIMLLPWTSSKPYKHVGCYRDVRKYRAFPVYLTYHFGRLPRNREVEKCAEWASAYGSPVFAVQFTFECWGSHKANRYYLRYGRATNCRSDGKGGDLANDVYEFTDEVLWPKGTYSILKPLSGCQSSLIDNGWLLQNTDIENHRSSVLNIDGYVTRRYVVRSFCTKTIGSVGGDWPAGQFCIYKEGNVAPPKTTSGSIKVDSANKNNMAVMNMIHNHGIKLNGSSFLISYFCQTTGVKSVPIDLPISQPFYLLPYGSSECQQVKWMVATKEWIRYGTRNHKSQKSWRSGATPYIEAGETTSPGLKMFYCHYTSCNITLSEKQGTFQSPRYPEKYPDGQLCSWRILVPVNHTVLVHFVQFYLYDNNRNDGDVLELHRLANKSFVLNKIYRGHQEPFQVSSTADLLFVFRSNQANSSQGFRAEYEVFVPGRTSSTVKPTSKKTTLSLTHKGPFTTRASTTTTISETANKTGHKASKASSEGTGTVILIVIPLVCLILIVVVSVDIYCRWKLNYRTKANRINKDSLEKVADNPTYAVRPGDNIAMAHYDEANTTDHTKYGQDDPNMGYEKLRRGPKPKHNIPAQYDQLNTPFHPSNNGTTVQENGPEHMYNVPERLNSSGTLSGNDMYHTIDTGLSSRNALYESADM